MAITRQSVSSTNNRAPIERFTNGNAEVAVFKHKNSKGEEFFTFEVKNHYKKDEQWVDSNNYTCWTLRQLAEVAQEVSKVYPFVPTKKEQTNIDITKVEAAF